MTKGIREFASNRFEKLLPKVKELGPTGFRRRVMDDVMKQFDITVASAATAYNHVLKTKRDEDPDSVEGIGRGQGAPAPAAKQAQPTQAKRGPGRPPKEQPAAQRPPGDNVAVVKARDGTVVVESMPRNLAKELVAQSGGRGRPKLVIQDELEVE